MSCSRIQHNCLWRSNPGPLDSESDALLLHHSASYIYLFSAHQVRSCGKVTCNSDFAGLNFFRAKMAGTIHFSRTFFISSGQKNSLCKGGTLCYNRDDRGLS